MTDLLSLDTRKAALYIRVSTEAQAEEGYSIEAQLEKLKAYCIVHGWENYEPYIDPGFSGSNLNRPKIRQLIEDVKDKKISTVVVYKLDRLSRSQKDTLYLIEDVFMPNGVDFVSINESIDTSTPYGRAMIGILSAFAQLERENIYMRTRMGMLERVKQGYWMGGSTIPYGYSYDRELGILKVIPEEAEIVKKAFNLYNKGYSPQKIADMFGLCSDQLVSNMLTRRTYLGVINYKGQDYPGKHEAIISEDVFNRTQQNIKDRGKRARASTKQYRLLTGIVYCGYCGARMRYMPFGKKGHKLWCYSKDKSKPYMNKTNDCPNESCWAKEIEDIIVNDLFTVSTNLNDDDFKKKHPIIDPLEEYKKEIEATEQKIRRLYSLFSETEDRVLVGMINENKEKLQLLKSQYEAEQTNGASTKKIHSVVKRLTTIKDAWPYMTDLERQQIVRDCIERVEIKNDCVIIKYTFIKSNEAPKVA